MTPLCEISFRYALVVGAVFLAPRQDSSLGPLLALLYSALSSNIEAVREFASVKLSLAVCARHV